MGPENSDGPRELPSTHIVAEREQTTVPLPPTEVRNIPRLSTLIDAADASDTMPQTLEQFYQHERSIRASQLLVHSQLYPFLGATTAPFLPQLNEKLLGLPPFNRFVPDITINSSRYLGLSIETELTPSNASTTTTPCFEDDAGQSGYFDEKTPKAPATSALERWNRSSALCRS